ncbi:MAG TPA: hypothetical protein VIK18_05730 [Pirellulales bacterium]
MSRRLPGPRCCALAAALCLLMTGIQPALAELAPVASSAAPREPLPIRPGESQMWLISTRSLPGPGGNCSAEGSLEVYYFPCGGGAMLSSLDEFRATADPQLVDVIVVHGNGVPAPNSVTEGASFCRKLSACSGRPMRFVIWSWPSEHQEPLPLSDLRLKLARTNVEAFYLADFVKSLPADRPLCLIGFSFGCRVAAGTLHVLGGGTIDGRSLELAGPPRRSPIRSVMLGAALGHDALLPQNSRGRALSQVDHMLVTVNPRDCVLRYFPLLREDRSPALGLAGMSGYADVIGEKITYVEIDQYLGRHHAFKYYLDVPEILELVRGEIRTTGESVLMPVPLAPLERTSAAPRSTWVH